MRRAIRLRSVLLLGALGCVARPASAQIVPFGVSMTWDGECSLPGVIGGPPPASVSGGSGALVGQASYAAATQVADCPGGCAPPPFPPDLCVGSRWTGSGSVALGTMTLHSEAWSSAFSGPGDYLAAGTFGGEWGDTLHVVSGSLPAGSPVKLRFELALSSTAKTVATTGLPCLTQVLARVDASFSAAATAGSSGGLGVLANPCQGTLVGTTAFVVDTKVGESFAVRGLLSANANSWAAAEFIDQETTTADALVDGSAQYHFYIDSFTADATYTTASGVTYVGPTPPPPCGNGVLDGGEGCDDGNLADGDCCSSVCQIEAAGTTCRAAADACDVAETCDGTSPACPADAGLPDADADGACDEIDLCTNVAGARTFRATRGPVLRLLKVNADTEPGNDRLALRAELDLPPGTSFSDLAFDATGLRLLLLSSTGVARLDAVLPPGAPAGSGSRAWTRAASGKKWTYADDTPGRIGGITTLRVIDRRGASGSRVRLAARGSGTYPVVASDLPVQALIVLGGPEASPAGRCGESAFGPGDCTLGANGERVVCRH